MYAWTADARNRCTPYERSDVYSQRRLLWFQDNLFFRAFSYFYLRYLYPILWRCGVYGMGGILFLIVRLEERLVE